MRVAHAVIAIVVCGCACSFQSGGDDDPAVLPAPTTSGDPSTTEGDGSPDASTGAGVDSSGGADGGPVGPSGPFSMAESLDALNDAVAEDIDPTLTSNMLEIYFASDRTGAFDIFTSTRASVALPWDPPTPVDVVNAPGFDDKTPELSEDGRVLLFASNRTGSQGQDIWLSVREPGGAWLAPTRVEALASNAEDRAATPVIGSDLVLLCSNRSPGAGGFDLYDSSVLRDGGYAPPTLSSLSGVADDCAATLRADQREIFFESNRAGGPGGWDVWVATRPSAAHPFGEPSPVAGDVNTSATDTDPWISPAGDTIVFASTRAGVAADLFEASRIP